MSRGPTKKALRRQEKIEDSKAHAQRVHAKRRMVKRHGITLSRIGLKQIVDAIQNASRPQSKARFYDRQSNRISRWHVEHEGKWYPVVYDGKRKTIVTVLPHGALGASLQTPARTP